MTRRSGITRAEGRTKNEVDKARAIENDKQRDSFVLARRSVHQAFYLLRHEDVNVPALDAALKEAARNYRLSGKKTARLRRKVSRRTLVSRRNAAYALGQISEELTEMDPNQIRRTVSSRLNEIEVHSRNSDGIFTQHA